MKQEGNTKEDNQQKSFEDYKINADVETPQNDIYKDADSKTIEEQEDLEKIRYQQDTDHRAKLVDWVIYITNVWVFVILVVILFSGVGIVSYSDIVMTTLLATTTTTIIGLPLVVLHGLFGDSNNAKIRK